MPNSNSNQLKLLLNPNQAQSSLRQLSSASTATLSSAQHRPLPQYRSAPAQPSITLTRGRSASTVPRIAGARSSLRPTRLCTFASLVCDVSLIPFDCIFFFPGLCLDSGLSSAPRLFAVVVTISDLRILFSSHFLFCRHHSLFLVYYKARACSHHSHPRPIACC